jgi:CO dehydrogenase maturation factor
MSRILATLGKGGVGKTIISAMAVKSIAESGYKVLAIDADPAGGLALALGLSVKKTVNDIRVEMIESIREGQANRKLLATSLDYHVLDSLSEKGNLAFLSVGRPEEEGCYCQLNTLLREAIEVLSQGFDVTVIDAEAGLEQISRRVMRSVDTAFIVSDTSQKGMKVGSSIAEAAWGANNVDVLFILNRVGEDERAEEIAACWGHSICAWLPEDETIYSFDRRGRSFLDLPDCPAYRALDDAIRRLSFEGLRP